MTGRIGEGGQGIVYLGVNEQGERAAIKLLHVKFSGDTIARSRFARELKAAQRVASFCTARVMEADLDGNTPYIASEYIDGRPLRELVDTDGPLSGTLLDRLAIGTATALVAIHHASIVHRDLKPDNVLIAADGPRVVDFGIARIIDSTGTITSRAIGTPAYMAPEQIAGDDIGPYTDVFAWGATIAFAATGTTVFEGNSIAVVLNRILNHEVDVDMMQEPLRGVVRGALAKSPADRPSADQILLRLLGQPETAGASTAVLNRGVQVASDDTAPFARVSVTDRPPTGTHTGLQQTDGLPPQTHTQGEPAPTSTQSPAPTLFPAVTSATLPPTQAQTPSPGQQPAGPTGPIVPGDAAETGGPARRRRSWLLGLGAATVALVAAAAVAVSNGWPPLAFGDQPTPTQGGSKGRDPVSPGTFASVVEKVAGTGKIVIGVKGDLPGIGLERGDGFDGFEVDLGKRIATELGAKQVEFARVTVGNRAQRLADGAVDLVLATYSVDKSEVRFAGPYYLAHHDVLVHQGAPIKTIKDLNGKRVCALNSTAVGAVQDRAKVEPVTAGDYAECMNLLRSGAVDAVPGDDLILAGFANRENLRYRVLGAKLSDQPYAVGIRNGDAKTCKAVKSVIADLYRTGYIKQLVTKHFAKVDFEPELEVPAMEPCE
ncbi:transporter substrate-binding domain-containing protein [Nonomuraea sp. NN258]|uniref:protein kinase domain-containing protein n=1 Tax=Nonomuraea antri TaxID=2730852 RepID=UPI0015685146|nr:transporter substrate-binding domain-containing protein [Nonomuraea antri]NRQ32256.1 transporter substrate-binding domain-containing protein [Nonomuraea antri]